MRWLLPGLLVSCLALSPAYADTLSSARSSSLVEKAHSVHITLRRDHAELRVTRIVHNDGEQSDQATFDVATSREVVATGLRTSSIVDGKLRWFRSDLLEADAAARKYGEVKGASGDDSKESALLSWREPGHLELRVFPCAAGEDKWVEYTLLAPMRYEAGRYWLEVPAMGTEELPATATFSADRGIFLVDDEKAPATLKLSESHRVELQADLGTTPVGAMAAVPFDRKKALFSYHLEIPERLSEVPTKARVVIVIDASHSFGTDGIEAARAAASAYISHFASDDVQVELLAFGRKVESLSHGFQKLSAAQRMLADAVITPRNGSEIGLALGRASRDLAASPAGAARRIVLFSDLHMRSGLEPERMRSLVPGGATLHIANISSGNESLYRDDSGPWATLARSTGGLLWNASASSDPEREVGRRRTYEELARPMRIDGAKLSAAGLGSLAAPTMLEEGKGLEGHQVTSRLVGRVTLSGELWSTRIERTLVPDEAYGRRRAALAFGTDLLHEADDAGLMRLARHGRAVTPVTSFLAIEPGARPPVEGLDRETIWGDEISDSFSGIHSLGLSGIGEDTPAIEDMTDYAGLLRALAEPGLSSCGIARGTALVLVESTGDEIAAVTVGVDGDDAKRTKASCLAEVVWGARLPEPFDKSYERKTSVNL